MQTGVYKTYYKSPIGTVEICSDQSEILSVKAIEGAGSSCESETSLPEVLKECKKQLSEYFTGKRQAFDLPLRKEGTPFQKQVWQMLDSIPYGETISYKALAENCRRPKACRAVGSANGKNQHWIIVPCHRVITSDGKLGGYAGGLWRKQWLLEHERNITTQK